MKKDTAQPLPDFDINDFIRYCQSTREESWCVDVVRSNDEKSNCLFGHIARFADDDMTLAGHWIESFSEQFATNTMVYPVNDGQDPDYQQNTPKQRCLAYLMDLRDGVALTTYQSMERDYQHFLDKGGEVSPPSNLSSQDKTQKRSPAPIQKPKSAEETRALMAKIRAKTPNLWL